MTKAELQAALEELQDRYQRDISERDDRISELTGANQIMARRLSDLDRSRTEVTHLSLELTQALGLSLFSRTHPELAERMNKVANG